MKLIVGLGNPGSRYAATRHNIGWQVLDALAVQTRKDFRADKGEYYSLVAEFEGEEAVLVKPTTYMNDSGLAVAQAINRYGVDAANEMLVVLDEIQMPLGMIRITTSGGDSGHNGMASIISTLLSDKFARLRCGIDRKFGPGEMVEYVLAPFTADEQPLVEAMVLKSRDAARKMISKGTVAAMNAFNAKNDTKLNETVS